MNLAKDRQDLFCTTMECLEVVEMPLCFWLFSRLIIDPDKRVDLYSLFETYLHPLLLSKARESAGPLPAVLIVKVLFTNSISRTDDLFANLNTAIIECGKEELWRMAWESLVGPQAYEERMARVRIREETDENYLRMYMDEMTCIRSRNKTD